MEETKYYVNRWYDDRSSDNPYSFELLATDEYIGNVGDIIEDIEDTTLYKYEVLLIFKLTSILELKIIYQ